MTYDEAKKTLEAAGQGHVLRFWDKLDETARAALLAQIEALDFAAIARMQGILADAGKPVNAGSDFEPAPVAELGEVAHASAVAKGEALLREGKVAVLLVAGGQGSRLGYEGPKGAYPIGPVTEEHSLFWYHTRKLVGLAKTYGATVPFYIMTSETNDAATRAHFEANGWFGMDPADVRFFIQGMWPALDPQGKIILDTPGHIFMSPDGHGGTLAALDRSGALADMARRGIEQVFFFQVDNPMVEVADPAFIGFHASQHADMTLKVCLKRDAHEGMGVVVRRGDHFAMVEYSELTDEQMERINPDGTLWLRYGSPAIHVFSYDFLRREADKDMPLHLAHKKIPYVNDAGEIVKPSAPNGYKFEKFIFDVMPNAKTLLNLAFDRTQEFSPVKNAEGNDSPATVRRDLQAKWRGWFAKNGIDIPDDMPIEIDPAYILNADQLRSKGLRIG